VEPASPLPPQKKTNAHALPSEKVLDQLGVSVDAGLSGTEVRHRRKRHGPNRLREARRKSVWAVLVAQFRSVIVYLLAAAAALSFSFGEWAEGGAILVVLAINAAIGFTTEIRALRSMEALRRLSTVRARVRREGRDAGISANEIVPGDIVLLESGDIVPADLRIVETTNLQCDESALTGESVPVGKATDAVALAAPLAERTCMAFKGTSVTRGAGVAVAVATGMATELGGIAALAESAEAEASPLEKRLDRLGGRLVWVTLGLTALIGATGVYAGHQLLPMIETAIALAVAAVPEGLPIVATVALARGMWRMARRNALIEKLSAVETLGATTVILTDKTGTLTENRMTVVRLRLSGKDVRVASEAEDGGAAAFTVGGKRVDAAADDALRTALTVAVLCNNASLSEGAEGGPAERTGDPMEVALLAAGRVAGLDRPALLRKAREVREEAFSAETKMMATYHATPEGRLVAVKGAPEAVIARSVRTLTPDGAAPLDDTARDEWFRINADMTAEGLRVLALATKTAESEREAPYEDLTLIGLVGLRDPPRPGVAGAIAACRSAGVRVVMLTGDHAGTAKAIATEVGLADADAPVIEAGEMKELDRISEDERRRILQAPIFARVSPKTKLELVSLYQQSGHVVAMTGDGVNDAPALKKADIGIAMGQRGTEVARDAADMVLRDDAFPSIVAAMRQGRVIFGNIRKFVVYLMSCNLSEILVIGIATLSGLPLPLLPLQILYLNLVTDVFPAFALGVGEGDANAMRRPPRDPREPILGAESWIAIGVYGGLITAATLGAFSLALTVLGLSHDGALTVSFLTLALAQLWHVFNMRAPDAGPLRNEVTRNPYVWAALAFCAVLVGAAVHVPGLSRVLGMAPPSLSGWALVAGSSLMPLLLGQIATSLRPFRRG
jgi:P-type Ca2+ transporter type 2C